MIRRDKLATKKSRYIIAEKIQQSEFEFENLIFNIMQTQKALIVAITIRAF